MTIHCRVISFLSADTSRDFVTLNFDLLTLNSCCAWLVTLPTLLPSLKVLCISVLDLWVITFPVGYLWKCVRGHCACPESRDPCVGGQTQLHFWYAGPRFAYSLCTFGGSTMKVIKVICENNARPCVKKTYEFLRMREITWSVKGTLNILLQSFSPTSIPYWTLKVEHIAAFTAIFSNICTALAQKRLFMNFWCKFRHRRSICRLRFPVRVQNFGDLVTFSVAFCIFYSECPPYFYFPFVWLTHLESIPHASTPRW